MNKFIDIITKHRNLSPITINNYNRGLNNLQKNTGIENHSEFIIKWRDIIKYIMDAPTKQPYKLNILNFYIVALDSYIKEELLEFGVAPGDITGGLAECRKHQFKIKEDLDILKYNETKSEKESTNWVGFEELEKCVKTNFKLVRKIIKSPNSDAKAIHKIHLWLISALYACGKDNPPLRLDFTNMRIVQHSHYEKMTEKTHNYLVVVNQRTKYFVLNEYKTFKKYGTKTIKICSKLDTVINKYIKIKKENGIQTDLLLFNNKNEPLSESLLSGYIGEAFNNTGKKITANLIRHIFITDVALQLPLAERNVIANRMCHNLGQQLQYNKIHSYSSDED